VLGYSKRVCERLTAHYALEHDLPYLSVRFGNVLFSRGSVLGTFRTQVDPPRTGDNIFEVTVTDASGNSWMIATHKEDVAPQELAKRAEAFYKQQKSRAA